MKEKREVITIKKQIPFIEQCMESIGYSITDVKKIDRNWVISMEREMEQENDPTAKSAFPFQENLEQKLRLIEITMRKKCGFNALFLNLMVHAALFCIQSAVLYRLGLAAAHPKIMLEVGIILFWVFLAVSFAYKLMEILKWNRLIQQLKEEMLSGAYREQPAAAAPETKTISVLFTRNHGLTSDIIYWVTGREYTHASLGMGEQTEEFYSFDYRGFRVEHPGHRKAGRGQKESLCYQFKVTPKEYRSVEQTIQEYLKIQPQFKYNFAGAVLSVFHIYMPLKSSKAYFCSEFVSQQLQGMQSFCLKKEANMYLPTNLAKSLAQQKNLCRVLVNEI